MSSKKLITAAVLLALPSLSFANNWADRVQFSGVVEVEVTAGDDKKTDSSDITSATVELGFDAKINDRVTGHVLLLHEEDDTPLELDEGTISLTLNDAGSAYMTAGQMYVPFGNFESYMISDPLTLELGETRQSVLLVGMESGGMHGSIYVYNGDTIEDKADDSVANFGANFGYSMDSDGLNLDVGVSYISNIADSFGISGSLPTTADELDPLVSYVDGFSVHAIINRGAITGIVEYVAASEFETAELAFKGVGASPTAMNIELAYNLNDSSTVAVAYQKTEEAEALGLVESKALVSYSTEIYDATSLKFEYAQGDYYSVADGGDGESMSALTAQLAVSF